MRANMTLETRVLGGLPVEISVVMPFDRDEDFDWWISAVSGRKVDKADWIYKRLGEAGIRAIEVLTSGLCVRRIVTGCTILHKLTTTSWEAMRW